MAKPFVILLGDLAYFNKDNMQTRMFAPLNVGLLAAYAAKRFGRQVAVGIFKNPLELFEVAKEHKPDLVGLTLYYWNAELSKMASRRMKALNPDTTIVMGGPCVDVDHAEQEELLRLYPNTDAIIPNEGEQGFGSVIEAKLGGNLWREPLPGVVFRDGDKVVRGAQIGTSTDLSQIPSPYLMGLMDPFLEGLYRPMIQTSRLCPYTCSFCVSGKDRGKLRVFDVDHVAEETEYIAKKFKGDPQTIFYLTDENFGILDRDIDVSERILAIRDKFSYPQRVFFYNDKRFTHIARSVHERFGKGMVWHGVCLSLQSDNDAALKAVKRRNLTDEQITAALAWAKERGMKTSTELIFGLPGETLESFCAIIDKCARFGFEVIHCFQLIMFPGIEMHRKAYREQYGIKTMVRPCRADFGWIDGELCFEKEEVVVATKTFSKEDFELMLRINILLERIYLWRWDWDYFKGFIEDGGSLTGFLREFLIPPLDDHPLSKVHRGILDEMDEVLSERDVCDRETFDKRVERMRLDGPPGSPKKRLTGQEFAAVLDRTMKRFEAKQVGEENGTSTGSAFIRPMLRDGVCDSSQRP